MPDPGFISGFINVGIDISVHYIIDQINIARHCEKELNSLRNLVEKISPIIRDIQHYRQELNWNKEIRNEAPAVNDWLRKLEGLLRQASAMVQKCRIRRWDIVSRYKTSKSLVNLNTDISKHLELVPAMAWVSVLKELGQMKELIQSQLGQVKELIQYSASSSATTSATASQSLMAPTGFFIKEPFIVGQHGALSRLQKLVIDETADSPFSSIGVFGKGGSGKTLLLKTLCNRKEVRDFFCDGLFLWLTVSQFPSFTSLLNELSAQIAAYTNVTPDKNMSREAVQIWLNERMQGKMFVLVLDDVWEKGAELLEELGLLQLRGSSNSKVIVSSRNRSALLGTGVPEKSIIRMEDLHEDDSWRLFAYHAFPYNKGNLPTIIPEGTAKVVCANCGGLPLVIKAVGRALAGITDAEGWEMAVRRLPIANNEDTDAVFHRLRLSYDALGRSYGVNLQMCFLYLASFREDQIIRVDFRVIPLWIGAGLLGRKTLQGRCHHDPFEMGKFYVNLLADRCLIEPIIRGADGSVAKFRMHDVMRDLAMQIAQGEENFYCATSRGLTRSEEIECSGYSRIFLNHNNLTELPKSLSSPEIRSLMAGTNNITKLSRRLMGGMISLAVLDLSFTSLLSLPDSVGCLKQLVFLNLTYVPITTLPPSLTNLVNLQILNLTGTRITDLPYDIHKLISLRYLSLDGCRNLQYLPYTISRLTSLQHFFGSGSMWTKHRPRYGCKRAASINDLGKLTQLKSLFLNNDGQPVIDGTFGNLAHLETLELTLTEMAGLPNDITNMAKLRRFSLYCPQVVKIESNFCQFQHLAHIRLFGCSSLEEVPHLHELKSLKQLDILDCINITRFPQELTEMGAFPLLETFSLVRLNRLEELPQVEEGAMLSLKEFTVIQCEALKELSESYLNLKTLQKIRVYGCSMVLKNLKKMKKMNSTLEVVTMSTEETMTIVYQYHSSGGHDRFYDTLWCNELVVCLAQLYSRI